ncbi:thioredoxin-like protein [Rhizodiscina lignyota]|uniref:Thioredoxin-like protein n=1 Tax=Rhizodiscina lignyota TaxID=1504668 RepID=A0A9P4IIH3_9PEZI|nr:thioredoxin-like protein [Rhizodiscina lignyota]
MTNFQIHIVSDTVCPWCYVGKKRLEKGIEQFKKENPDSNDTFSTTWAPFYLDPEAPNEGEDKQARYARRFGAQRSQMMFQRLAMVGDSVGINFKFGGRTGNTRDSHRLIQLAKTKSPEMQTKVVEKLFEAYFEKEQDITSHAVLLKAAVEAGLDQAEAKDWLETDKGGPAVDKEVKEAQMKFIGGVPHFTISDRVEIEGADDPSTFVEAFKKVKAEAEFEQKRFGDSC